MNQDIQNSVRKGAEALDKELPDWERHIDTDTLDMRYCEDCIVGHLQWRANQFLDEGPWNSYDPAFGFAIGAGTRLSRDAEWEELTEAWIGEVLKRRALNELEAIRIGEPKRRIKLDPVKDPVPRETPQPQQPTPAPKREPVKT